MFLVSSLLSDHHEMFVSVTSSASLEITPAGCTHDPTHDTGGEFKYSGALDTGQETQETENYWKMYLFFIIYVEGERSTGGIFSCVICREQGTKYRDKYRAALWSVAILSTYLILDA